MVVGGGRGVVFRVSYGLFCILLFFELLTEMIPLFASTMGFVLPLTLSQLEVFEGRARAEKER